MLLRFDVAAVFLSCPNPDRALPNRWSLAITHVVEVYQALRQLEAMADSQEQR